VGRKVILDTSALMSPFRAALRLEDELQRLFGDYEAVVPGSIEEELRGLARGRPEARAAMELVRRRGWQVVRTATRQAARAGGDSEIVGLADELGAAVVTNDRSLREELRGRGVTVAYLRAGKRLEIDGVAP
jgi:hypothetical protein